MKSALVKLFVVVFVTVGISCSVLGLRRPLAASFDAHFTAMKKHVEEMFDEFSQDNWMDGFEEEEVAEIHDEEVKEAQQVEDLGAVKLAIKKALVPVSVAIDIEANTAIIRFSGVVKNEIKAQYFAEERNSFGGTPERLHVQFLDGEAFISLQNGYMQATVSSLQRQDMKNASGSMVQYGVSQKTASATKFVEGELKLDEPEIIYHEQTKALEVRIPFKAVEVVKGKQIEVMVIK